MYISNKDYPNKQSCLYYGEIYNCAINQINDVDDIKNINGDYCLVLCKDDCLIAATDPFRTQLLFYNIDTEKQSFAFSNDPRELKRRGFFPYPLEPNTILMLDFKTFNFVKHTNKVWDLTQKDKTNTKVFDAIEQSVGFRYNDKSKLMLSDGYDSGVTACALWKQGHTNFSISFETYNKELPIDRKIIKQRLLLHKGIFMPTRSVDLTEIYNVYKQPVIKDDLSECYCIGIDYLKKRNIDSIITAYGGAYYMDYGFKGRQFNGNSYFGGLFPNDLRLVYPRITHGTHMNLSSIYMIALLKGTIFKQSILDPQVVQAWINTSSDLKNKRDRNWMWEYMTEHNYPFNSGIETVEDKLENVDEWTSWETDYF